MTPSQSEKRIAIAEHFGWRDIMCSGFYDAAPIGRTGNGAHLSIPDYFGDLRDTHEAENALSRDQHRRFRKELWSLSYTEKIDPEWRDRTYASAPASLRAEALFETLCSPEKQPAMKPVSYAAIAEMNKILFQ